MCVFHILYGNYVFFVGVKHKCDKMGASEVKDFIVILKEVYDVNITSFLNLVKIIIAAECGLGYYA